jgi:predicted regulator of Ras-like GTPase activity (Roadblock/LC7/MglB family)
MNTISKEFSILPGVLGSCVSGQDNAIHLSDLPAFFSAAMVSETSSSIGRMIQMARVKGLAPQTMSIRYDKFDIIAKPITPDATLLIICEPGSNTALVTTTAQMLAPEIEKNLAQASPTQKPTPEPEPEPEIVSEIKPDVIDDQTSSALSQIKQALLDTVGPVADMVYDDCLERWTASSPANISRIIELVGCISSEIDNPDLFEEFKQEISALL